MKRHKHLYDEICTFPNLLYASEKARRGKRGERPVRTFHHHLEYELIRLQNDLREQTYQPGAYHTFTIHDTKPRLISAAPYRDRVVHHALCNIIEPIWERGFIYDSYASRVRKGTHAACNRLTRFMHQADYVLKCDIRKYFPSIDHAILKQNLRRKVGCARTLWLLDRSGCASKSTRANTPSCRFRSALTFWDTESSPNIGYCVTVAAFASPDG